MRRSILFAFAFAFTLLAGSLPAEAQWARVTQLPVSDIFSVWANRDTIVAGTDTSVFVSTDAGATWHSSSRVTPKAPFVMAARVLNGRLFAGTSNQGVFVSDDLGATWAAFNQGLVGGIFDSQLSTSDFAVRGDELYVSTLGAGVYVRPLVAGGTWHHFGETFEPNQASNVNALAVDGGRLIAAAGANGTVFRRDPGDPEWSQSFLNNVGLVPGIQAQAVMGNGSGWVVGTLAGVFRSATGHEPWTLFNPGLGVIRRTAFAARERQLFAAFDLTNSVVISTSSDDGASWSALDNFPLKFVYQLAMSRADLYAARADGLFRRSTSSVSVPDVDPPVGLRFGLAGRQPVGDQVRFRIEMPEAGAASIEVFDVTGRRASAPIHSFQSAGAHELNWDARALSPGVFFARLTVGSRQQTLRLVHVR